MPPFVGRAGKAPNPKRRAAVPMELIYDKPLQVGARTVTIRSRATDRVGVTVFANTPPNHPWYDAETRDNLAVDAQREVTVTVNIRAVGDRIKAFRSTGPASRDFSIMAESDFAEAAPGGAAPPTTGTGNAAAMFAKMGLGINQERFTAVNHAQARTAAYYQYYRTLGIRNVRFFIPAGFDSWMVPLNSSAAAISGYLDAVQACVDSGMPASHIDGTDVIGDWNLPNQAAIDQADAYVQMFAAAVAARNFPVDKVIVGSTNEYGAGTNAFWEPHRLRWNGYLRAALPNHTIVEGPCNWKDPRALFDPNYIAWSGHPPPGVFNKWSDTNTIIDCHHYLGWDTSAGEGMDWIGGKIKEWSKANNRGVYMGEHGFDSADGDNATNAARWISRMDNETQYENVCLFRPCLWAATDGSAWPVNKPGTNTMRDDVDMAGGVKRWAARVDKRVAAATPTTSPTPTEPSGGDTLNILVRGQSNAYYFCEWGNGYPEGVRLMKNRIQELTGRTVNLIYGFQNAGDNTIYSGTQFLTDWMSGNSAGSLENAILRYVGALPAAEKTAPFVEIWMHNESDQKEHLNYTTATWVGAVRAEAGMMRTKLGLTASQHLRYFVPIRYPYGDIKKIRDGMDQLAADGAFNARVSMAAWSLRMNGGPEDGDNSSHMGPEDASTLAENLAQELAKLYPKSSATSPPQPDTGGTTTPPAETRSITLSPKSPGARPAGVWNTTATVTGLTSVSWVVQNGEAQGWTWAGNPTEVTPSGGQVSIAAEFDTTGQFVNVFDTNDQNFQEVSDQVTIV